MAGISWRQAARYCNWLHNGKSSDPASLLTGAYDTSTWGGGTGGVPATDAERHLPGAVFWIPTIDEWIKAAHYDPNRYGAGEGGYWQYNHGSDLPPIAGLPGAGQTNAGLGLWQIPVGSYPDTQSPYGLLDMTGGAREYLEDIASRGPGYSRYSDGAATADLIDPTISPGPDIISFAGAGGGTSADPNVGLRVASIPCPPAAILLIAGLAMAKTHTRRTNR